MMEPHIFHDFYKRKDWKAMRVYKFIHSCLVVQEGGDKILFDPGMFSFMQGQVTPDAFRDVGTIIITHNHPDHVDVAALQKIVELSGAMVITNSETQDALTKEGIESIVLDEGSYRSKDFTIRALPANHAEILSPTLPQNTAYIINDSILNPGDSFATLPPTLRGIKALALVVAAPWTTEVVTAEFAETIAPQMVIPVHDGYIKSFFQKMRYDNYDRYFSTKGITFLHLVNPGDGVEIA
jgi:L-ascorbate metabolism protein UlaG (beta-lactamase superfamily)